MTILAGLRLTAQVWYDNAPHVISGGYAATTSNSAATTTEIVYLTSASMTLRNGRAYEIEVSGMIMGTSPDVGRIMVKRTNTSGATLLDTQGAAFPRSGNNGRFSFTNIATNQSGSDLTGVVVATIQRMAGTTANVSVPASTTSPAYLRVMDVGAATDYANATPIT